MRLNQNGLSLIEITIAAALTAIVALSGAFVVARSQQTATFSTIQNDIDRVHYLNIQVARNVNNVLNALGINPMGTIDTQQDPNLVACLQMKPNNVDCTTYNTKTYTLTNQKLLASSPDATSSVQFGLHCGIFASTTGCDAIIVTVTTQFNSSYNSNSTPGSFIARKSISNLPNYLFIPRNSITYNCPAAGQVMNGIDYYNQDPLCTGVTGVSGSTNVNGLPIIVYDSGTIDSWSTPNTVACPDGYVSVGFGSGVCRSSSNLTTPPPTTTTTTPPGPTTTTTAPATPNCKWNLTDRWSEGVGYNGQSTCLSLVAPYPNSQFNKPVANPSTDPCFCGDHLIRCQNSGSVDVYKEYDCY